MSSLEVRSFHPFAGMNCSAPEGNSRWPSRTPTGWHVLVSLIVSFSYVQRPSAHTTKNRQPRSGQPQTSRSRRYALI